MIKWSKRADEMRIVIQIAARDDAKAWDLLQRHSPGVALPNRTYIVSDDTSRALTKAGIRFTELSREGIADDVGAAAGERI
jgi:hypothetical protein